jgi:hypothetical protein
MRRVLSSCAFALLIAAAGPAIADDSQVSTLANILLEMNHFPNEAQKEQLAALSDDPDVSENLRAIASATAGIEHTPSAEAQATLNGILASEAASPAEKTLAGAVLRFRHELSVEDRAALEDLSSG